MNYADRKFKREKVVGQFEDRRQFPISRLRDKNAENEAMPEGNSKPCGVSQHPGAALMKVASLPSSCRLKALSPNLEM
jgi:hypothetical protein